MEKKERKTIVIDATDTILGRLASHVAKQALLGKEVIIINCESVLLTGRKRMIIDEYKELVYRGGHSLKGPFHIKRSPERIVKRTIRGMLDHKRGRGSLALSRIMCYNSIPEKYASEKAITLKHNTSRNTYKMKELVKEL